MVPGTYYVDLCPARALAAAVGDLYQTKKPFLFSANNIKVNDPAPYNMSIAFEVTSIHNHEGFESVAFSYYFIQIDADGNTLPAGSGSFVVDLNDPSPGLTGRDFNGITFAQLDISRDVNQYTLGDKFYVTTAAPPYNQITIASDRKIDWQGRKEPIVNYTFNPGVFNNAPIEMPFYQIDKMGNIVLSNIEVAARWPISHNHDNGRDTPYAAKFTIADTGATATADFYQSQITCTIDRQYTGEHFETTAGLEAPLRSIKQFYDANGRFLLDTPQTLSIRQANRVGSITLYADDTIADVLEKLNANLLQASGDL